MELSSNRSVDAKSGKGQSTKEVASITRLLSVLPPLWVIIIGVVVVVVSFIEYFLCDYIDVWYIFFSEHFTIPASTTPPTRPTSHDTQQQQQQQHVCMKITTCSQPPPLILGGPWLLASTLR